MAGYVALALLAAIGAMSALWAALGWLLPGGEGMALVCAGAPDENMVRRYRWLRGLGLLRCPLLATQAGPWRDVDGMEVCAPEQLLSRLELEREHIDGRTGDPPGRHQRRGVSEL